MDLYEKLGLTRDLDEIARLLSKGLKFIADVGSFCFIATSIPTNAAVLPTGNIVWVLSQMSGFYSTTFSELSQTERLLVTQGIPIDWERGDGDTNETFGTSMDFDACKRVTALPALLPERFAAALLVGTMEVLSKFERKILLSLTKFLCNSVASIWQEREQILLLEQQTAALQDLVDDLSRVVSPVWDHVLMVPLVGRMDDQRITKLIDGLLAKVQVDHTQYVIFDLTGVSTVDDSTVGQLSRLTAVLRLLGTQSLFVGINSAVARRMVSGGSSLRDLNCRPKLEDAIIHCMNRIQR